MIPLPAVDDDNRHFWQSGRDGVLQILRCGACGWWIHQPQPVCPECLSTNVLPQPTAGRAVVQAFTVNHQQWVPDLEVPYVIAIVELGEQTGLRLMTRLVDIDPGEVHIGLEVEVVFEQHDDVWLPLFRPVAAGRAG